MKEEFDLSRYLNHPEESDGSRILSELISKAVSTKQETGQAEPMKQSESSQQSSVSEQKLPSESLNEAKDAVKAEHSEQEKRQAVSSIPRRISHKQRQESLDSYREAFLTPHKIIDRRQPISVAPRGNVWSSLSVAWAITGRMFQVSWNA